MIGSLSLLAASSPESLWKGWRYGECKKWKRLDSQREAKVVMATVTKAKTLKSNKAQILYIAGGKPCDAEMVRQPALARAIKNRDGKSGI